ncbi:MAG: hypothetical protein R3B56_03860 [Candidatus Scalinduaceae bacterium]
MPPVSLTRERLERGDITLTAIRKHSIIDHGRGLAKYLMSGAF